MRRTLLALLLLAAACGGDARPESAPAPTAIPPASPEIGCDGEPLPPRRASLVALDSTGAERFRVALPAPADDQSQVPPVESERHVYVVSGGAVRALTGSSGEQRWERPVEGPLYGMHLDADVLVLLLEQGSSSAHAVGLDLTTGEQRWRHDGPGPGLSGTPVLTRDGGIVWIAQGRAQVLDLSTGRIRWTAVEPGQDTGLAVGGGLVLRSVGEGVTAYDALAGQVRWRTDDLGPATALHVVEESVVIESGKGSVRVIGLPNGKPLWEAADGLEVGGIGPDGVVLHVPSDPGFQLARHDTGRPQWSAPARIGQHLPALVGGGIVVTVDADQEQTALVGRSSADGSVRWRHDLGAVVMSPARLGPDAVLAVTGKQPSAQVAHVVDIPTGGTLAEVALDGSVSRVGAGERGALLQVEDPRPVCPGPPRGVATPSTPPAP